MGWEELDLYFNPPLTPNEQLYKFTLINRIGTGNFGEIWLAQDESINRQVAVKILDASQAAIDEHIQEAHRGNLMDHANLVKIHYADATTRKGTNLFLIAMDYQPNGSLIQGLNAGNFMPIKTVLPIISDVLRGLEFLHEQDLYHNDIKPKNILLGNNGEGILTDYGISVAGAGQAYVTPTGAYKLHTAPELIANNHINGQTDIYQVGLTMFRLLNGIGKLRDKLNSLGEAGYYQKVESGNLIQPKDYLPFIPRNLKSIITKATHVDPTQRFQTPLEMRRRLEGLNYVGDWTYTPNGNYMGHCVANEYRFEESRVGNGTYNFTAFKKNKSSQNERRMGVLCKQRATKQEVEKAKRDFMQKIVMGS
ncbi:MAG: hypothetical protein CBB87_06050 [Micavibrio sp. TMED27]|nr:serine/threonine protein kinase [Micavibrio sp.]OUT91575.1 MAG: hypothetical protein CBB87_06050 [Micavibrio sp. TMED27]